MDSELDQIPRARAPRIYGETMGTAAWRRKNQAETFEHRFPLGERKSGFSLQCILLGIEIPNTPSRL